VESFKCNFPRLFELDSSENNLDLMQENIIEMKEILKIINEEYSDYLSNYELENTKVDWTKKIETIVENIESYNLSEEQQNRILELAEQILTAENINVEEMFVEINQILGYNL